MRPQSKWSDSVHWLMTIKLNKNGIRDKLNLYLKDNMIDSRQMINPVNQALHFKKVHNQSLPNSVNISKNSLHLPSSNLLTVDQIEYISNKILKWLKIYG